MFWNSKRKEMEDLRGEIENLRKYTSTLHNQQRKLERILKYAKADGTSFRILTATAFGMSSIRALPLNDYLYSHVDQTSDHILCIYDKNQEYAIPIREFRGLLPEYVMEESNIYIEGELALLDLVCYPKTPTLVSYKTVYHYTIQYKEGRYVCWKETVKKLEKEKEE